MPGWSSRRSPILPWNQPGGVVCGLQPLRGRARRAARQSAPPQSRAWPPDRRERQRGGGRSLAARHGLLQASFIAPRPIRELRELTRCRKRLVQDRAQQCNRLQKILERAASKLAAVATAI